MRLITHNMLKCNVKGVENGYPLVIQAEEVTEVEADNPFDLDFMRGLLKKINMKGLRSAIRDLQLDSIDELSSGTDGDVDLEALLTNVSALENIHHLLFEINVETAKLICPETGREFNVNDGIPNMLLHEDEI
jgi:multifunctional methyltransferase subunit TRM112